MIRTTLTALALLFTSHALGQSSANIVDAAAAGSVLEKRCMVCHGCFDAPCQLKLTSQEGLERGASKDRVYDAGRLRAANVTRLFDDGFTLQQWREKGFYSVLNDKRPEEGVMYRMLELKQQHPLPASGPMPKGFDFSLARKQQCTKPEEFDKYARDNPLWGMPFGLPGLNEQEHNAVIRWLEGGAPIAPQEPLSPQTRSDIESWERFINGTGTKERLMSRYLYEHLFLANLYFPSSAGNQWFRMVRSRTAPGKPIDLIATRRPFDSPGDAPFYYRLQRMPVAVLAKRHMPYILDDKRMDWYRELFLEANYELKTLPGYDPKLESNPFVAFDAIPVASRYEFLLEEARFSIMNFIKGPVCRGQVALNVIDDRFWVMFLDPEVVHPDRDQEFLRKEAGNLRLPVSQRGNVVDLLDWRKYAKSEARYAKSRAEFLEQELQERDTVLDEKIVWDGDGHNANAALTVFRHFDTATVVTGFVGDTPKTAWLINYTLLERIHYLLVAGFDVYGDVAHQLESRLYMDFLRMEGETNFLMMLPPETRAKEYHHWYRNAPKSATKHVFTQTEVVRREADIEFKTDDPKAEFLALQKARIYGAKDHRYVLPPDLSDDISGALASLQQDASASYSYMPQVTFLNVLGAKEDYVFTLLRDSGYSNIAQLFKESDRRLPNEDRMTVVNGFLGAYPNLFFQVPEKDLAAFTGAINNLRSRADYMALLDRYGVRRNAPWFWRVADKFHGLYREQLPLEAGLFDLNRYQHLPDGAGY